MAYAVPTNFYITADNRIAPLEPTAPPSYEHRELNAAEETWLLSLFAERLTDAAAVSGAIGRPFILPSSTVTEHDGLPEFRNDSPRRQFCIARWGQMISPYEFRELINRVPIYSNGVSTAIPLLKFVYNFALLDMPSDVNVAGGDLQWVPAVSGAPTEQYNYRVLNRYVFEALNRLISNEERRRRYAETVADLRNGDTPEMTVDFYAEEDEETVSLGRLWPAQVVLEERPFPSVSHPVGSGGWFPFLLTFFEDFPLQKQFFAQTCDIHANRGSMRVEEDLGLNTEEFSLGCFWKAMTRYALWNENVSCHDWDQELFTRLLYSSTTFCPAGSTASAHPDRCRLGSISYRQVGLIVRAYNSARDVSRFKAMAIDLKYNHPFERTAHGRAGKAGHHVWRPTESPATAIALFRLGCFAGHYFPLVSVPGLHKYGLKRYCDLVLKGQPPLNKNGRALLSTSSADARKYNPPEVDSFTTLQIIYDAFAAAPPLLAPLFLRRLTYGDLAYEPPPLGKQRACKIAHSISRFPYRFATFSPCVDFAQQRLVRPAATMRDILERHTVNETPPLRSHYVVDYEDISSTHDKYLSSVCSLADLKPVSFLRTANDVFAPSQNLFFGYLFAHLREAPKLLEWGGGSSFFESANSSNAQRRQRYTKRRKGRVAAAVDDEDKSDDDERPDAIIWCHNLQYDFPHLLREVIEAGGFPLHNGLLPKQNRVVRCLFAFPNESLAIECRDSWRLFGPSMSVAKMPAAFNFAQSGRVIRKEFFLHDAWLGDGVLWREFPPPTLIPLELLRARTETVPNGLALWDFFIAREDVAVYICREKRTFDLWRYAQYYCEQDVYITARALQIFQTQMRVLSELAKPDLASLDALSFLSASSLSHGLFLGTDAYAGVYEVNGLLNAFFQNFIVGGRCCLAFNQKRIRSLPNEGLVDWDARSLYPSAFKVLCDSFGGLLTGIPRAIDVNSIRQMDQLLATRPTGFFVILEPLSADAPAPRYYPLGLYAWKPERDCDDATRRQHSANVSLLWINDVRVHHSHPEHSLVSFPNGLFFDAISFSDYLTHQPMYTPEMFHIRAGYAFYEPRNPAIATVVEKLYNARLSASDPALKNLLKLILNGAYGKTLQKAMPYDVKVVQGKDAMLRTLASSQSGERVQGITNLLMGDREKHAAFSDWFVIQSLKGYHDSYSLPHIGGEVLSAARLLMNRLTCLFDWASSPMELRVGSDDRCFARRIPAYTDTDSVHFYAADVPWIEARWAEKYPATVLMGEQLLQFHSDFDDFASLKGQSHHVVSDGAIFLGKKAYCHRLRAVPQNVEEPKFSLKGIPHASVVQQAATSFFQNSVWSLFETLFLGNSCTFDLQVSAGLEGKRPLFALKPRETGFAMVTLQHGEHQGFLRSVRFT